MLRLNKLKFFVLIFIGLFQVAIILCWNHCSQWIERPLEGYVWEHDLATWANLAANPSKRLVYDPVVIYNPETKKWHEEWQWVYEPYEEAHPIVKLPDFFH